MHRTIYLVALVTLTLLLGCTTTPTANPTDGAGSCATNADCAATEYCAKAPGDCEGVGECVVMPQICTMDWSPVCGCDGKTYSNACGAAAAGTNVAAEGECP